MVHREKIILKIARRTITIPEIHRLNSALSGAKGFDYQDLILERHGFSRGKKFGPDNYHVLRDGDVIDNAFLSGDYHGAQVFLNKNQRKISQKFLGMLILPRLIFMTNGKRRMKND